MSRKGNAKEELDGKQQRQKGEQPAQDKLDQQLSMQLLGSHARSEKEGELAEGEDEKKGDNQPKRRWDPLRFFRVQGYHRIIIGRRHAGYEAA